MKVMAPPMRSEPSNVHSNANPASNFQIPSKQRKVIPIRKPEAETGAVESSSATTTGYSDLRELESDSTTSNSTAPVAASPPAIQSPNAISSPLSWQASKIDHNHVITPSTSNHSMSAHNANRALDIFSPVYVPYWLRAVNESKAHLQSCRPFPTQDFRSYITTIIGPDFAREVAPVPVPPPVYVPTIEDTEVDTRTYTLYWLTRLQNEFSLQSLQYNTFALYNRKLIPVYGRPGYFLLHVPGLRENAPRIDLGDTVNVRLLHPPSAQFETDVHEWETFRKYQGVVSPGFTGILYDPCVWEIDRGREIVTLRIDSLVNAVHCNIIFLLQHSRLEPLCRAVHVFAKAGPWLRRMLFPQAEDGVLQESLSQAEFAIPWKDDLNWEQKKAVHNILSANYGNLPYLISGPPGTGKTKTLVETALQLLMKPGHLLICAPSDQAADIIALRLRAHLKPDELFRLNGWTRTFAEVPEELLPYCHVSDLSFSLPPVSKMLSFRIVVTTCRDADLLNRARLNNVSLSPLFNGVMRLLEPRSSKYSLHWTALLLDEAAQATEPETLIPLSVVMPPVDDDENPQFVAVGDQNQLGPKLVSNSKLSISLFQRLFERDMYSKHPLSRKHGIKILTSAMLPIQRPPFTNLVRNYRSHAAILSVPSSLFYNDTLIPERNTSNIVLSWASWPKAGWPVLFQQNTGEDYYESVVAGDGTGTGTLYNPDEADYALHFVLSLLQHANEQSTSPISQREIMIMSPFRAQVFRLRQIFRQNNLFDVNIGPMDAFQGLESRIVIICTTRTRMGVGNQTPAYHVSIDKSRGLGIIDEPQQFNVALTRAQEGLIVIGNAHCLTSTHDPHWLNFLDFCKRNNCFKAPPDFTWPDLGGPRLQGQLELALLYKELRNADTPRDSSLAREADDRPAFRLKGLRKDLDEEMWQLKELAQSYDSENVDLVFEDLDEEYSGDENEVASLVNDETKTVDEDYDRNLRQEFHNECNTQ